MNQEFEDEVQELRETISNCRSMLSINPMELDVECRNQPEKFEMVGQLATRAKALSRKAKDQLDYTESDLKSKVRKDPVKFGLVKVTEGGVTETVEIQKELQDAKREYIELSQLADGFSVLVNSMEQRKAMLRDLVSLYIHKYYSNQSLSGEEKSLDKDFEEDLAEERSKDMEETE